MTMDDLKDTQVKCRIEMDEKFSDVKSDIAKLSTRMTSVENLTNSISQMGQSINTLAVNMQNMTNELKRQGERLDALEGKPGKIWETIITYAVTTVVGLVIGYFFSKIK